MPDHDETGLSPAESEARLRAVLEAALEAIVTIDAAGTIESMNPAAESMFGYGPGDLVGCNVSRLMPSPHAEQHDEYVRRYLETGEAHIIGIGREVEGLRSDGTTFPVHLSVARVPGPGAPRFVGTLRDLTEIREAHEDLRREHALLDGVVRTAHSIVLRLDEQGRILSFNPFFERLSGYTLEKVVGRDWFETFLPEPDRGRLRGVFRGVLENHSFEAYVNPIVDREGKEHLIEWRNTLLDLPGEPISILSIGQDITDRRQLEREYMQAQKMEAVGRLTSGIAHDFNNLLAGVISGCRIAAEALENGHPALQMLEQVKEEAMRGSSLTRHLLDFSRKERMVPTSINVCDTIAGSVGTIRRLLGEDVDLRTDLDSRDAFAVANPSRVEQALLNLAVNARDAMMPNGGQLSIDCRLVHVDDDSARSSKSLRAGPHVLVTVADTGSGMDERTLSRATEAFFTTKPPGQGTGLGLSSVAGIMEEHGGHLELESRAGEGTRARLYFPHAPEPAVLLPTHAAPRVSQQAGGSVLVVEDEKLVRLGIEHSLRELGYDTQTARDPREALDILGRGDRRFDLLLTDIVMPGMNGPELVSEVQRRTSGMRVLYMSAFPAEELVAQGRIPEGVAVLEKPFTDEALASRVLQALADPSSPR